MIVQFQRSCEDDSRKTIQIGKERSKEFEIAVRLVQGNPPLTLLFNLSLEEIVKENQFNRKRHLVYRSHLVICYAEDTEIVRRNEDELKEITINIIKAVCR